MCEKRAELGLSGVGKDKYALYSDDIVLFSKGLLNQILVYIERHSNARDHEHDIALASYRCSSNLQSLAQDAMRAMCLSSLVNSMSAFRHPGASTQRKINHCTHF